MVDVTTMALATVPRMDGHSVIVRCHGQETIAKVSEFLLTKHIDRKSLLRY